MRAPPSGSGCRLHHQPRIESRNKGWTKKPQLITGMGSQASRVPARCLTPARACSPALPRQRMRACMRVNVRLAVAAPWSRPSQHSPPSSACPIYVYVSMYYASRARTPLYAPQHQRESAREHSSMCADHFRAEGHAWRGAHASPDHKPTPLHNNTPGAHAHTRGDISERARMQPHTHSVECR